MVADPITFGPDSRWRIIAAERSSAYRLNDTIGRLGPPSGTRFGDANNALIEVHEDTPRAVAAHYDQCRMLHFQFIDEGVTDTSSPTYEQISVLGRSEGYMSYGGSPNRTIALELAFCASVDQGDDGNADMAARCARWLQSLMYPTYSAGGIMYPPPLCRLLLGKWIDARGVVTSAPIQYQPPFVGDQMTFEYPMIARVSLEFTVLNTRPMAAPDFMPTHYAILNAPGQTKREPIGRGGVI